MTTESAGSGESSSAMSDKVRLLRAVRLYLVYAVAVWPIFFAFTWLTGPNHSVDAVTSRFDPMLALAGSGVLLFMGFAECITIKYPNPSDSDAKSLRSEKDDI